VDVREYVTKKPSYNKEDTEKVVGAPFRGEKKGKANSGERVEVEGGFKSKVKRFLAKGEKVENFGKGERQQGGAKTGRGGNSWGNWGITQRGALV